MGINSLHPDRPLEPVGLGARLMSLLASTRARINGRVDVVGEQEQSEPYTGPERRSGVDRRSTPRNGPDRRRSR